MNCDNCGKEALQSYRVIIKLSSPQIREYWCRACHDEKYEILDQITLNLSRAAKLGLPCTLTKAQWKATRDYFNGRCAYCLSPTKRYLEHFIPLSLGGGTTVDNCVPACARCNSRKRNKHPDNVTAIPHEAIERVRIFLDQQKLMPKLPKTP